MNQALHSGPATHAALEHLVCTLHELALDEIAPDEIAQRMCRGLADALGLSLVLLARKQASGAVTVEAASSETALCAELYKLPERWDSELTGQGPAGTALRTSAPARIGVAEEGFMLWRLAAERDGVRSSAAWPFATGSGHYALVAYSVQERAFEDPALQHACADFAQRLHRFWGRLEKLTEQRLLAHSLESAGNAAFVTDLEGTILWSNPAFSALSGHSRDEVRGCNPRFLKSGRQGLRYYRELWATIRSGRVWSGETVDRDRSGVSYTIHQTISPVIVGGRVTHYLAIHDDITRQKREQARRELRQGVDPVTGLLTPAAFEETVRQTMAIPDERFRFVLLSLRELHGLAAKLGEAAEEMVGAAVGERIREQLSAPVIAGVLGPGDYGLVVRGPQGETDVHGLVQALSASLSRPYPVLGDEVQARPRTATASYPLDGRSFDELQRHADRQLADRPMPPARRLFPA